MLNIDGAQGTFRTHLPSAHAITNLAVIEQFLPVRLRFDADAASHVLRAETVE